jgi:hypothetical protein
VFLRRGVSSISIGFIDPQTYASGTW